MAKFYSNHFSSAASALGLELGHYVGPSGGPNLGSQAVVGSARRRVDISTIAVPLAVAEGDVFYMTTMKAVDRITEIRLASEANGATTLELDLGIYANNARHDGAVIDVDCFSGSVEFPAASAIDYVSGFGRTSAFATNVMRGVPLYALAQETLGQSGAYDICITIAAAVVGTADATPISLYVEYVGGD